MYFIRRLSKCSNLYKLKTSDYRTISSDLLYQEMRTTNQTLSVWHFEAIGSDEYERVLQAALLTGTSVESTQFIIISSDELTEYGISYVYNSNPSGYIGMDDHHTDLCNLSVDDICRLLSLFTDISRKEGRTPKIEKTEFIRIIKQLDERTLLDRSHLNDHLVSDINRCLCS